MKRLVIILALVVGGCAQVQQAETTLSNAVGVIGGTKINSKTAYVAINAEIAAEKLATTYLNLPQCNGTITLCRQIGAANAIAQPFNAAIQARLDLREFMRTNKGTLADAGLYTTLVSATAALKNIMAIYGVTK